MKYGLSPREIPWDIPRAQAIFHSISLLLSQYRYNVLYCPYPKAPTLGGTVLRALMFCSTKQTNLFLDFQMGSDLALDAVKFI